MRLRSLKSRLAVWVVLPWILVVAVDLVVSFRSSEQVATLVQQRLLHGAAAMISEQLTFNEGAYEISVPPSAFELLRNRSRDRVFYAIYDRDGYLVAGDGQLRPYPETIGQEGEAFFLTSLRGEKVMAVAYAYVIPNSPHDESVITQVAQTLRDHDQFRDELLSSTLASHLRLLIVALYVLFIVSYWTLKPLFEFRSALEARQPGSLEKLDEKDALRELEPVVHALNDYVQRLDHTLKSYEKFVADTAHHLRNSFAIIASQVNFAKRSFGADSAQQEVLGAVQKTLGKCARIINQLLMLAALEQHKRAAPAEKSSLAAVAAGVMEELAPLGLPKGIELGVDALDENAVVAAPERLLRELLTNLIGNAIAHMNRAGHVTVSVVSSGSGTLLTVADDGVGIPEALRERVFERFFRVDASNSDGSGLGMAIVKEICDSLGAEIRLSTPSTGSGLRVDVRFPP
jgi:two-component system sensor histidine kinase TctE